MAGGRGKPASSADLLYISKPEDLVTSYNETRASFIAVAFEKNRRVTPYIEEARVLQHRIKKVLSPDKLLDTPDIRNGLIAAAGLFDKAARHLGEEGCITAIREFIEKFLVLSRDKFKEELIFRFLLIKGDSLGGKMRNIVGALAQRKLCLSIISALKMSNIDFFVLNDIANQWISSKEINDDTEIENSKRISWKKSANKNRTLYFNITVPVVGNNIDIILQKTLKKQSTNVNNLLHWES